MAIGVTLSTLVSQLRSEIGASTNVGQGVNNLDNLQQVLRRTQEWLYQELDWPHLIVERDKTLLAGQRYYSFDADINPHRVLGVYAKSSGKWNELSSTFEPYLLNTTDSDTGATGAAAVAWRVYETNQFEIWPTPADSTQTVRFRAIKNLAPLLANSDVCSLDSTLIVLFAAADVLARLKSADAELKQKAAQELFTSIRRNVLKTPTYVVGDNSMAELVDKVLAELGNADQAGVLTLAEIAQTLRRSQDTLYTDFDWPFLVTYTDHAVTANTRYVTLNAAVNPTRIMDVYVNNAGAWQKLSRGFDPTFFNQVNSESGATGTSVNAWTRNGSTQIELWPIPASNQTIRVAHIRKLNPFVKSTDKAELDANSIVLFAAVELLQRLKAPDIDFKYKSAQQYYNTVKASYKDDQSYFLADGSLNDLVRSLKAEVGENELGDKVSDTQLTQLIRRTQETLYNQFDWPFLIDEADQTILANATGGTFPTAVNPRRILNVYVKNGSSWQEIQNGFTTNIFNTSDPASATGAPIVAWRHDGAGGFEVWPKPSGTQTLRFRYVRALNPLLKNRDVCELDKNLIILTAAAELLAKLKSPEAEIKLKTAQALFDSIKKAQDTTSSYLLDSNTMIELSKSVAYECGLDDDSSVKYVPMIKQILMRTQTKLYNEFNWPFLITEADQNLTANTRYYTFPTNLNPEKILKVHCKYSTIWQEVQNGFYTDVYNYSNSDGNSTSQPVSLWRRYSATQYEVWPMPSDNSQIIRFRYVKNLLPFLNNNDVATLDRDLLVLFATAELAARLKLPDAEAKLVQAQAHYRNMRATTQKQNMFVLGNGMPKSDRGDWVIRVNPV